MAILVSGGAGYIGSHTCIELLNAGFDIVVADNYYNASPVVLDRVKQITGKDFRFYQADMTKHEDVEKIFTECPDIDAVIQFAAYKAVGESVSKPIEYKLLCVLAHNVGKVLTHTSLTQKVWGSTQENDIASLRVYMASLRKKLERYPDAPHLIQTHVGVGYRMLRAENDEVS